MISGGAAQILLSCEHGGNKIPAPYKHLFSNASSTLATHRGWDIGALKVAKAIGRELRAPLHHSETSRLLVELNRSAHHPKLFSEFTRTLSAAQKQKLLKTHYFPYRSKFENLVLSSIAKESKVILHFSIHSFTPVLGNEIRDCEVGLLYDPRRPLEREIASIVRRSIKETLPDLRVRMNYPYLGKADGFTSFLRSKTPPSHYSGIEIELNQKLLRRLEQRGTHDSFTKNLAWTLSEAANAASK